MIETQLPTSNAHMLTISNAVISLQDAIRATGGDASQYQIPSNTNIARIIVESESIRILSDGNIPTASVGLLLDASGNITGKSYEFNNIDKIKMIRAGASDATVYISIGKTI